MIHWFGDSWTVGDGLAKNYGLYSDQLGDSLQSAHYRRTQPAGGMRNFESCRPDMAFPALICKKLNVPFTIHGNRGDAISQIACRLKWWLDDHDASGSKAVFALPTPGPGRHFYIDNDYKTVYGHGRNITPLCLEWQRTAGYFQTTININWIYTTCLAYNIKPYFFCTWSIIKFIPDIDMVPDNCWIIPHSTTLSLKSFGETYVETDEKKHFPPLKYCVSKDDLHPNFIGQQKLANTLFPYINEII